jgi:hypothetical protein
MISPANRAIYSVIRTSPIEDSNDKLGELPASIASKEELLTHAIKPIAIQDIKSSQSRGRVSREKLS